VRSFVVKIFLFVCGVVALFESMLFFMVALRRIPIKKAISFYGFLSQTPNF